MNMSMYQQVEDFKKYASFLCENFDIQIVLDSTKAETDGKTIYLPNLEAMTSQEIEMLYSILLHEVGHIRYSDFSEKAFAKIKTQWHAFMANAIEDARIENLLLKDFAGAKDMFESLYCDFINNKALTKKIFKYEKNEPQFFESVAFYAHHLIVDFKTLPINKISSPGINKRVLSFYKKNNLVQFISNYSLKNWDDVIALTNHIYDLFVKEQKDTSEKISIKVIDKKKNDLLNQLSNNESKLEKIKEEINQLEQKKQTIIEEIEQLKQENLSDVKALENDIENKKSVIAEMQDEISQINEKLMQSKQKVDAQEKLAQVKSYLEKNQIVQQKFERYIDEKKNRRGKDLSDEEIVAMKADLKAKQQKFEEKSKEMKALIEKTEQLKDAEVLNQQQKDSMMETIHETEDKKNHAQEELNQLEKKLENLNQGIIKKEEALKKVEQKMEQVQKDLKTTMLDMVYDMQDMNMVEGFNPNLDPAWPEAGQMQNEFDRKISKETGQFVSNGLKAASPFGSNLRDMTVFIDKSKEKVQEINVFEIFKDQIKLTNLEEFNNESLVANYQDKSTLGVAGTRREHIPSTTAYDRIVMEQHIDHLDKQAYEAILQKNHVFFSKVKNILQKKLKFSKKDFWRGGQEEGRFDNRNLWKLPTQQGNDFYEINDPKYINKVAATILIDVSGSNDIHIERSREVAIAISLALSNVHVKHEVLGYHAPVCTEMRSVEQSPVYTRRSNLLETIVYKSFEQKESDGLFNIKGHMTDNSDGESLRIAVKRLKAKKAKNNIVFIINDGKPFLSDTDISVLDEDFRQSIVSAVRQKINLFGFSNQPNMKEFLPDRSCDFTKDDDVMNFLSSKL